VSGSPALSGDFTWRIAAEGEAETPSRCIAVWMRMAAVVK
jgi:hypothetical protein